MASSGTVSDLQRQILELRNELKELKSSYKNLLSSLKHNEYGQPNSEDSTPVTTGDLDILIGGASGTRARNLGWDWSTWQSSRMSLGIMSEIESPYYDSLEDSYPGSGDSYFALSKYIDNIKSYGLHTSEVLRDLEVYMTIPDLKATNGSYDKYQAIEFKYPFYCTGIIFGQGPESPSKPVSINMSIMPDFVKKVISFNSDTISFDSILAGKSPIITTNNNASLTFNVDNIIHISTTTDVSATISTNILKTGNITGVDIPNKPDTVLELTATSIKCKSDDNDKNVIILKPDQNGGSILIGTIVGNYSVNPGEAVPSDLIISTDGYCRFKYTDSTLGAKHVAIKGTESIIYADHVLPVP